MTNVRHRSVEKGMEILPPFETPIGRVGLSICFDVSYQGELHIGPYI
jgi:predicted amidohydrolase